MTEQNTQNSTCRTIAEGKTLENGTTLLRRSPRLLSLYNDQARRKNVNVSACKTAYHSITGAVSVVGTIQSPELSDGSVDVFTCRRSPRLSLLDHNRSKDDVPISPSVTGSRKTINSSNASNEITGLRRSRRLIQSIQKLHDPISGILVKGEGSEAFPRIVVGREAKSIDAAVNSVSSGLRKATKLSEGSEIPGTMFPRFSTLIDELNDPTSDCPTCEKDVILDNEGLVSRHAKEHSKMHEASVEGWTKHQQMSLQIAYFATKPTPRFWKKVSKMVPGKSAIDCYNKVHADHVTPPPPMPSSRAKIASSLQADAPSLSASKLLLNPCDPKIRRLRRDKQKKSRLLVHKTIRKLLRSGEMMKQKFETDLFSILEPCVSSSTEEPHPSVRLCSPSPSCRKPAFSSSLLMDSASPHVLKPIKNRALHEKYIDQLHHRDAKRKAACVRVSKLNMGKENCRSISYPPCQAVAAAKNAMASQVEDAICQIHHLHPEAADCDFLDDRDRYADGD